MHICAIKDNDPKDKGKLAEWVYGPECIADPGQRKKVVAENVYALASLPVKNQEHLNKWLKVRKNLELDD